MRDRLRELLIRHEGIRLKVYKCTAGKLTIGCGRNLDDQGISEIEAQALLTNDMNRVQQCCIDTFPWFKSISVPRQDVVVSMVFNLGLAGFQKFKKAIAAISAADFPAASREMLNSEWSKQVGHRAEELAFIMREDRYPF